MKKNNQFADNTLFYRGVRRNGETKRYDYDKNNNLILLKPVFWSSKFEASVYHAILLDCDPYLCRKGETDGVVGITAQEINLVEIEGYKINVYLDRDNDTNFIKNSPDWKRNNAHAVIAMKPLKGVEDDDKTKRDLFGDVSRQLCKHSSKRGWIIEPPP